MTKGKNNAKTLFILALVLVTMYVLGDFLSSYFVIDIDKNKDEIAQQIVLDETSVIIEKNKATSSRIINIAKVEGAEYYDIKIYPEYDIYTPIFSTTKASDSTNGKYIILILLDSVYSKYEKIVCVVTAYNADKSVSSNLISKRIDYTLDGIEELPDDSQTGIIEGIDNTDYYYSYIYDTTCLPDLLSKDYALVVDSAIPVRKINAMNITADDYKYIEKDSLVVIKNSYLKNFAINSRISFEIIYEDNSTKHFIIAKTAQAPYSLSSNAISYTKYTTTGPTVNVYSGGSSTGVAKVVIDEEQYSLSSVATTSGTRLTFKPAFLDLLPSGDHEVKLYFGTLENNVRFSILKLTILDKRVTPHKIEINYDIPGKVLVSWDCHMDADETIVHIGSQEFSSLDSGFASLFGNKTFNAKSYLHDSGTKVHVTAIKDGISYSTPEDSYAYLDINLSNATVVGYLNDSFEFIGEKYNKFISSEEELNIFTAYNAINYSDDDAFRTTGTTKTETYSICSPYILQKTKGNAEEILKLIENSYLVFVEPVRVYIKLSDISLLDNNVIRYTVNQASGGTRAYNSQNPNFNEINSKYVEYPYSILHYYTNGESTRKEGYVFEVDKIKKEAKVSTSVELYLALEKGYKPVPQVGSVAEYVYNEAKEVLMEIIDDRMNDYEKVLAIYDWITYNNKYDEALKAYISKVSITSSQYESLFRNPSFFAEGLFRYHISQCNGIAAAFSIMSNIEGIKCVKTMGTTNSGAHAWVKVRVDGEWYICDPTWSAPDLTTAPSEEYIEIATGRVYEYITYDYFMRNEAQASSGGRKEYAYSDNLKYFAGGSCEAHSLMTFEYKGKTYDYLINSLEELQILINYYTQTDENKVLTSSNEPVFFSIKGSGFTLIDEWMKNNINYDVAMFTISYFKRNISTINNVTYFRIGLQ